MFRTSLAAASLGTLLAGSAFAQQMTAQQFVTDAASGGMYEVQSSQFILDQGQAPADVSEFAQHMVDDHSKANDKLRVDSAEAEPAGSGGHAGQAEADDGPAEERR